MNNTKDKSITVKKQTINSCAFRPKLLNEGLSAVYSYKSLWDAINGKGEFAKNPFVWVYDFKVVPKPSDFLNIN